MNKIECPYCGKFSNPDDMYNDGSQYGEQCEYCGKYFVFTPQIRFPCLNGENHDWRPVAGHPAELYIGTEKCHYCNTERETEPDKRRIATEKYFERLRSDSNK